MTVPDATLGGYFKHHDRPPAFGGSDGHAYSVSVYVDTAADGAPGFSGALLFVRWSESGDRPTGHLETDWLVRDESERAVKRQLLAFTLEDVKAHLERAIAVADPGDQ